MTQEPTNTTELPLMRRPVTRRGVLIGAGAGVALIAAACSSKKDSTESTSGDTSTSAAAGGPSAATDGKIATLAASLEVLAVGTYNAALEAAKANEFGTVPPAVETFATTAMSQHQEALDKWNSVLSAAGAPAVSAPPADLKAKVDTMFAAVKDATGVANLALTLETIAADTYLAAIPKLQSKDAITLAGALQIVDQEHAAILYYVLGQYPVPDVFQKTDKAYSG